MTAIEIFDFSGRHLVTDAAGLREVADRRYGDTGNSFECAPRGRRHPCLSVQVRGGFGVVHYFLSEHDAGEQSVASRDPGVDRFTFCLTDLGDEIVIDASALITEQTAIRCLEAFCANPSERPRAIEWSSL